MRVVGHTDDVGNAAVNQHLSQKRAEAVVAWLVARGIAPSRLAAEGKGESEPIVDNSTAENRQINRRVDFIIEE